MIMSDVYICACSVWGTCNPQECCLHIRGKFLPLTTRSPVNMTGGRGEFCLGFFPLNLLLNKKLELNFSLCSLFEDYLRAKLKTVFKFYIWWQEDRLNVELMQNS